MQVEQQIADAGAEMVKVGPDQPEQQQLGDRMGEAGPQRSVGIGRRQALLDPPQQQRNPDQKQQRTAQAMEDRNDRGDRLPDRDQVEVDRTRGPRQFPWKPAIGHRRPGDRLAQQGPRHRAPRGSCGIPRRQRPHGANPSGTAFSVFRDWPLLRRGPRAVHEWCTAQIIPCFVAAPPAPARASSLQPSSFR